LTAEPEQIARKFTDDYEIAWPTAYGLSLETMNALGVTSPGEIETGMDVTPTIYILDAYGKVLWSDHGYRTTHPDVSLMLDDLETQIELALLPSSSET
jgi:hypothetical protein